MATIEAKILNVSVNAFDGEIKYHVKFDKTFEAIVKDDDDNYVEGNADYIDFIPRVLIAQALELVPNLSIMYSMMKESALRNGDKNTFGATQLAIILRDAEVTLEREKHETGEEYTNADGDTATLEHDCYFTTIKEIKVTDKATKVLDRVLDKALGF